MLKKFNEYLRDKGIQVESFTPDTPKNTYTSDGKDVAGLKEVIEVEGLGKMKVKLDSGNTAMNALIVQDYYEDKDDGTVKFDFNGEEKKFEVVKHIRIWHHGKSTERPVIKVNIKFNGKEYKDEFVDLKISDLTGVKNYRCRMLLCKDFMAKAKIVVDPSKEFKLTDKKDIKKKKKKMNESIWSDMQERGTGDIIKKEDELPPDFKNVLDLKNKIDEKLQEFGYDKCFKPSVMLRDFGECRKCEDLLYCSPYDDWEEKYDESDEFIPIAFWPEDDTLRFTFNGIDWEGDDVDHAEIYAFFLGLDTICDDRDATIYFKFWAIDSKGNQTLDFGELAYDRYKDEWYWAGNWDDWGVYEAGRTDENFERFLRIITEVVNPNTRYKKIFKI